MIGDEREAGDFKKIRKIETLMTKKKPYSDQILSILQQNLGKPVTNRDIAQEVYKDPKAAEKVHATIRKLEKSGMHITEYPPDVIRRIDTGGITYTLETPQVTAKRDHYAQMLKDLVEKRYVKCNRGIGEGESILLRMGWAEIAYREQGEWGLVPSELGKKFFYS